MMQDHITYHPDEIIQIVERKLDELKPFQYDSRYRALLGEAFVRKISDWERNIRSRKDDPFTLVVCGEFKRGKSSLINAILAEDVVTTNVTTETVTLNKISYGPHSNEAVLSGGRRLQLSDDEMQKDNLEALMARLGEPIRQLEIKRPIDLLKKVTIVDTPGLGDALQDFSELVDYALRQADAVIYVFSANYPLSQTEQLFVKTEILPQKYTELFLVANYSDTMPDMVGYERMYSMLQQRIQGLLPGRAPVMLSALDERCLQCGEERPNLELQDVLGENFAAFCSQLETLVEQKKYMVIPDRMQRLLRAMVADLNGLLNAAENGLKMNSQDVQAAMDQLTQKCEQQAAVQEKNRKTIRDMISKMCRESHQWIGELLNKMEAEVNRLSGVFADDLTKYYSFYCIDKLQEGMGKCVEYHNEQLYDELDDISSELTKALTQGADYGQYHFRFALDNQTWTKGDNVSYVAGYVAPMLGLGALSLICDGITGAMRQKEMKDRTPDLLRMISEQYLALRGSAEDAIDATYDKINKAVANQMDAYYAQQLRMVKEQVDQSALVARQDAQKKEEIRGVISQIRSILAEMENLG